MSTQQNKDALLTAIQQFALRLTQITGKLILNVTISPTTGELRVNYSDCTTEDLGVVRGDDGLSVIDVELYVDPLDSSRVFFQTTLSDGLVLRTQNSISGYNGKSLKDVRLENDLLIFQLDDVANTELTPIPVAGLQATSVVGASVRDDGDGPELFFELSNGQEIASGIAEDLRGRGVENIYKRNGELFVRYDNAPDVEVKLGDAASVVAVSMINGSLFVTLDSDAGNPIDLGPVGSITGAFIEGNRLKLTTNQPEPNNIIDVGQVADLKGDTGVGVQSVGLADNELTFTLDDGTVLPPLPVSGLTPISIVGARYDTDEDELYLSLTNGQEIVSGLSNEIRGRGIIDASVDSEGKLFFTYSTDPLTPVEIGTVPAVLRADIENGTLRFFYSTAPTTPVNIGQVLGLKGLNLQTDGKLIATYSNDAAVQIGVVKAVSQLQIVADVLRVNYNDGTFQNLGSVVGRPGDTGIGIADVEIGPTGDLMLLMSDGEVKNAGFARSTTQNFIGQTYTLDATAGQTVFEVIHENSLLFFVNGQLVPDSQLQLGVAERIVYTGPELIAGDKIKIVVYSTTGVSPTGRGVVSVDYVDGSLTAYRITLEDQTDFTIETETPINLADLPPGISSVRVLPNGNLEVALSNGDLIDAGATSNAINTANAYIDPNGILQIVLSDGREIPAGNVISNLNIDDAQIVDGDLVITFAGGGVFNAGPSATYPTAATINEFDQLIITLSNGDTLEAGTVRNPLLGSIYDFICFEGQFEFPVVHNNQNVLLYANGVALSEAALDLTGQFVKVVTPRIALDIVRIVLLTAGNTVADALAGAAQASPDTYYGKSADGNIGFHPIALTKISEPFNFVATLGQRSFSVAHNGFNSVEVFVDGALKQSGYSTPSGEVLFAVPLTEGQLVRVNLLRKPLSSGDLLVGNYARVAYEIFSNGGTFAAGAWRVRAINKVLENTIGLNLDTSRMILPAGKYYIKGHAACVGVRQNALRLFDQTSNELLLQGPAVYAVQLDSNRNVTAECFTPISGYFELALQSAVVLQHRCITTVGSYGFGRGSAGGFDSSIVNNLLGLPGRLVDLEIWRIE